MDFHLFLKRLKNFKQLNVDVLNIRNKNFEILSEDENIKIIYSDDGCGIPEENLGKIFEPFFTTKRNQGGTGLGLHIVYNLITYKLQGSIDVNSLIGKGSQFTMIIPSNIG